MTRAALITGAGTGIGAATVRALHAEGYRLALSGRGREKLEAVAPEGAVVIAGDITTDAKRIVDAAHAELGALHVVINNAGAIRRDVRLHELDPAVWDEL